MHNQDQRMIDEDVDLELGIPIAPGTIFEDNPIPEVEMFSSTIAEAENEEMIDTTKLNTANIENNVVPVSEPTRCLEMFQVKDVKLGVFLNQPVTEDNSYDSDKPLNPLNEENMALPILERICKISSALNEQVNAKREPIDIMQKLNIHIWQNQAQIATELANLSTELRQYVIKTAFTDFAQALLKESIISKPEYLRQIAWFFKNIMLLFPKLMRDPAMCHCVEQIFSPYAQTYKSLADSAHITGGYYSSLRQNSLVDWINNESVAAASELSDIPWRESLKADDYIDCLNAYYAKEQPNKYFKFSGWQPAKIVQTETPENEFLTVSFLRCPRSQDIQIQRNDLRIKPFRTYTDQWDLRFQMVAGDLFECADEYGVWYKSTALQIDEFSGQTDVEGNTIPRIVVAFRFFDENGTKTDTNGSKYTGYSEKFDRPYLMAACNIQKLESCSYHYLQVGGKEMSYDVDVKPDIMDTLFPSRAIHEWAVKREHRFAGLQFVADIVDEFGRQGGFEIILQLLDEIADGHLEATVSHLLSVHSFLVQTLPNWTRQFTCFYSAKVGDAFIRTLTSQKSNLINGCTSAGLSSLVKSYQNLLQRFYTKEKIKQFENNSMIKIGCFLINQENLQKRIQGIKFVTDQIYTTRRSQNTQLQFELVQTLQEHQIFSAVFDPKKFHSQVVKRSQEIIKIYYLERQINQPEIDLLWESAMIDETSKHEVYQLFSEALGPMRDADEVIKMFLKKLFSLKPEDTDDSDTTFIKAIGNNSPIVKEIAVDFLWRIVFNEQPGYSRDLVKPTKKLITELLRSSDRDLKDTCIAKCIDALSREDRPSYQATSMLVKILEMLPKWASNYTSSMYVYQVSLKELVRDLCETQNLIGNLLSNLGVYLSGKAFNEGITHYKNVQKRLKTILFLVDSVDQKTILTAEHVETIWDMLMIQNDAANTDLFFNFLRQILDNQDWCTTNSKLVCALFRDKVLANFDRIIQGGIHMDAFQCIKALFLQVNELENNLNIISRPILSKNATEYQQKRELIFRVHMQPSDLIGMNVIWESFQASCYVQDQQSSSIGKFITQIYLSTSQMVSDKKRKVYGDFTDKCFDQVHQLLSKPDVEEQTKSNLVKNTMNMLLGFFEDSEKLGGTAGIRPHYAIDTQTYSIDKILISNLISGTSSVKYLLLSVPSNMTVWELISFTASKINKSPLKILLRRGDKKSDLLPSTYCCSLRKMGFESGEEIMIVKSIQSLQKVPLINHQTNKLVKEAEHIFKLWFNKYSVPSQTIAETFPDEDQAEILSESRYMTKETALQFLQNALNERKGSDGHIPADDIRIQRLFNEYDTNKDGRLTLSDFLRFYTEKSVNQLDVVWQNLQAHGVGHDLLPEIKNQEETTFSNDPALTKDQTYLPRSFISTNNEKLDMLFNLDVGEARDKIYKLIGSLQTNPMIFQQIVSNDQSLLRPDQPVLKLLYSLQILKHLINKYSTNQLVGKSKVFLEKTKVISKNYEDDFPDYPSNNQIRTEEEKNPGLGANNYPASGRAIALPAAAEVSMATQDKNNEKLSYNQQQMMSWKGEIVEEMLPTFDQNLTTEQLEIWLPTFLIGGGFKALVAILRHFVAIGNWNAHQRRCVRLATQMIKIILVATFFANSADRVLVGSLQRKMSLSKEQDFEETKTQETNLARKQEELKMEFGPMTELILVQGFQSEMLLPDDPNMNEFSILLQQTFEVILRKSGESTEGDNAIVAECLNIWCSEITFNANRLLNIYNDEGYVNRLIEQGLLSKNNMLRNQFKEAILFVCSNVKQSGLPVSPSMFFLRVLLSKLQQITANATPDQTAQYFSLLRYLMKTYYDVKKNQPFLFQQVFDAKVLTKLGLDLLNTYDSAEKRFQKVDHTLVGLLRIVRCLLISESEEVLTKMERSIVLKMLVEKCLFNQNSQGLECHITDKIDLQAIQARTLNSCHSKESQQAAYELFNAVIGSNPDVQVVDVLLTEYWAPLIMRLEKHKENNDNQQVEKLRSQTGFAGIKNLGSICYMNAMIQQFYHVPTFRYCLLAACDGQPGNIVQNADGREIDDNSLHQWLRLFGFLELSDRADVRPNDFCFAYKTGDRPVDVRVQHDAQEFLIGAFDKLENSLKQTPMKYLCQSVFQGQNTNLTICKDCGNTVKTEEPFYSISLQVKNKKTIYESLRSMVAGEQISGYKCSACKATVDIEKKLTISKLPNVLIVQLNRIVFDFDQMRNVKLNDRLEFPNTLNLQEYMLSSVLKEQNKKKIDQPQVVEQQVEREDAKEDEEMVVEELPAEKPLTVDLEDPLDFDYKLVGVVVHMGTADAGHYISYINTDRSIDGDSTNWGDTHKQNWFEFNDSKVERFDFSELEYKCFGETQTSVTGISTSATYNINQVEVLKAKEAHNAYMLVYEKRRKVEINIVSLVCDSTAIPRGLYAKIALPSLSDRISQGLFTVQNNESIVSLPFYDVNKFIPNEIYKQINEDNKSFLAEKQVFTSHFFETTHTLMKSIVEFSDKSPSQIEQVYTLLDKIIFELMTNLGERWHLTKMVDLLLGLVKLHPNLLMRLINERILKEIKQGAYTDRPFFEALVFNKDQEVREMIEQILTFVTNVLFDAMEYPRSMDFDEDELANISQTLAKVVKTGLFMMPNECQKAWHKLGAYFNHYYNMLKTKVHSRMTYYKGFNLVGRLVDLISRSRDNNSMGNYQVTIPIDNAVKTISLLVRSQPLMCYLHETKNELQMTVEEILQEMEKGVSPYFSPLEGNNQIFLDAEDLHCLFMDDKKTRYVWDICFKNVMMQDARIEMASLVAHLCYRNLDFSRRIGKVLLMGLNRTSADELAIYLPCMQAYLTVPDEHQKARIEWILGFPTILMVKPQMSMNDWARPEMYHLGVKKISDIQDMVYEYKTFLYKEESNMHESVLHIMYNYRKGNFQDVAMSLLDCLLDTISTRDGEGIILNYLLRIEGPSYTCNHYWDWIEPFIVLYIQDTCGNNTQSMELCFKMLQNIEKIKTEFALMIADSASNQNYLTWEIIKQAEFQTVDFVKKQVTVVVTELVTSVSKSTPNPADQTNSNLAKVSRAGWHSSFQQTSASTTQPKWRRKEGTKKSYGRGHNIRGQRNLKNSTQSKVKTPVKKNNEIEENGYTIEPCEEDEDVVNMQVGEDAANENLRNTKQEEALNQQDDLQFNSNNDDVKNKLNDLGTDQLYYAEDLDFDPHNQNKQESPETSPEKNALLDSEPLQPIYPTEVADPDMQDVPQESDEDNGQEMEDDTKKYECNSILLFTLRNFHRSRIQKVTIRFDQSQRDNCNYNFPFTDLPSRMSTCQDRFLIKLVKRNAHEPWGHFFFDILVDDDNLNGYNQKYCSNYPDYRRLRAQSQEQEPMVEVPQAPVIPIEVVDEIESGYKACPYCTYHNLASVTQCLVCESSLI